MTENNNLDLGKNGSEIKNNGTNLVCWHSKDGGNSVKVTCADDEKYCIASWKVAGDKITEMYEQGCRSIPPPDVDPREFLEDKCQSHYHNVDGLDKFEKRNSQIFTNFCTCTGNLCNGKKNLIPKVKRSVSQPTTTTPMLESFLFHDSATPKGTESDFALNQTLLLLSVVFGVTLFLIILFGILCMCKDRFARQLFINSPRKFIERFLCKKPADYHDSDEIREHDLLCVSSDCDSDKRSQSTLSEDFSDIFDLICDTNQLKVKGRFGLIYVVEDKVSRRFCLKVSKEDNESKNAIKNEIKILQVLSHSNHVNIVKYFGSSTTPNSIGFFMEYCTNGSLRDYLDQNTFDQAQFLSFARDLASAIAFLHSYDGTEPYKECIVHRDICSANMLLRGDLTLVAADFGTSTMLFEPNTISDVNAAHVKAVGTPFYIAPEVLNLSIDLTHLSNSLKQADVYSMSLVMWEMTSRCSYFYHSNTTLPSHTLPYQNNVSNTSELIDYVVFAKRRPKFHFLEEENETEFNNPASKTHDPFTQSIVAVISQCWDKDEDTRLSASCVCERIASLAKRHLKTAFIAQTIT